MTDIDILQLLTAPVTLALTMYGEARGDRVAGQDSSVEERIAVGCVIRNRVNIKRSTEFGADYKDVCLHPLQFSCWNNGGVNHAILMHLAERWTQKEPWDALAVETLFLATGIINDALIDQTQKATHYYAPAAMIPPGRVPSSAVGKSFVQIGTQHFYIAA